MTTYKTGKPQKQEKETAIAPKNKFKKIIMHIPESKIPGPVRLTNRLRSYLRFLSVSKVCFLYFLFFFTFCPASPGPIRSMVYQTDASIQCLYRMVQQNIQVTSGSPQFTPRPGQGSPQQGPHERCWCGPFRRASPGHRRCCRPC